jgi:CHASE2 domain-containing sensor protein
MENEKKIWFPAKRYGWGWGPPCAWQGWLVMLLWLALLCAGACFMATRVVLFVAYAVVLSLGLIAVCLIKGEKPRWRWGKN